MNAVPNHVAIIMDGNGRWATKRGLKRSMGHKAGSEALERLVSHAFKKGVKVLSVFAFSTENFKRSKEEVDYLMNLFVTMFQNKFEKFKKENIKIVFSKKEFGLPEKLEKIIKKVEEDTKNNTKGIFNICINYGGRDEIIDTTKKIAQKVKDGILKVSDIDENTFEDNLYQKLPDIDLLIRTSGEERISNFMLWKLSYAEMYFPKVLFPDFDEIEFDKAIDEYNSRDRRFGSISS